MKAIVHGEVRLIDLLCVQVGEGSAAWSRYAHSYIGFGPTRAMAIGLEKGTKGTFSELVSVVRALSGLTPVEFGRADGSRAMLDSLTLANIAHIARYGRLSAVGKLDKGTFEASGVSP